MQLGTIGPERMGAYSAAIESGAPARVLTTALYERFTSGGRSDFADRNLSAMRYPFGGHVEKGE